MTVFDSDPMGELRELPIRVEQEPISISTATALAEMGHEPLGVVRWEDVLAPRQSEYVVKGLIDAGTFGLMFGQWGASKTFLALSLAAHIAAGKDWMGLRVRQAGVVYVCAEGSAGFIKRAAAVKAEQFESIPLLIVPQAVNLLRKESVSALAVGPKHVVDGLP